MTAPIWDVSWHEPSLPIRGGIRTDDLVRPITATAVEVAAIEEREPSLLPAWLDDALRDPAIVVGIAAMFGLAATALAGAMGFLLGLLVG